MPWDEQVDVRYVDTFAGAFSCLRSLLGLTLCGADLDPLLAHAHLIPNLRRLIIECANWDHPLHCSDDVLLSLLSSSPNLCVEWLVYSAQVPQVESSEEPFVAQTGGRLMRTEEPDGMQVRLRLMRDA